MPSFSFTLIRPRVRFTSDSIINLYSGETPFSLLRELVEKLLFLNFDNVDSPEPFYEGLTFTLNYTALGRLVIEVTDEKTGVTKFAVEMTSDNVAVIRMIEAPRMNTHGVVSTQTNFASRLTEYRTPEALFEGVHIIVATTRDLWGKLPY